MITYHFDSDPRFPSFLLYVRCNLGSLLYGDISVMRLEMLDLGSTGIVLCSENKGADQLHGYCTADQHLCFRMCENQICS